MWTELLCLSSLHWSTGWHYLNGNEASDSRGLFSPAENLQRPHHGTGNECRPCRSSRAHLCFPAPATPNPMGWPKKNLGSGHRNGVREFLATWEAKQWDYTSPFGLQKSVSRRGKQTGTGLDRRERWEGQKETSWLDKGFKAGGTTKSCRKQSSLWAQWFAQETNRHCHGAGM